MTSMLVHRTELYHLKASLSLGIPHTFLLLSATRKFPEAEAKAKAALK